MDMVSRKFNLAIEMNLMSGARRSGCVSFRRVYDVVLSTTLSTRPVVSYVIRYVDCSGCVDSHRVYELSKHVKVFLIVHFLSSRKREFTNIVVDS